MSQNDFDLFQQMMGDVKPITHDTAELKKSHTVTDSQLAKRESAMTISEGDPDYLSIDNAPMLNLMTLSNTSVTVFKKAFIENCV